MNFGIINQIVYKNFTVVDGDLAPVTGLSNGDFVINLFGPDGSDISNSITVNIIELSNGNYRASFIPIVSGEYFLVIYNTIYFPAGKTGSITIYEENFDSLGNNQKEILGLVHSNIFIDNTVFDANNNLIKARIRIYSNSSSVGSDDNVIGTYQVNADSNGPGKFKTWKQIKT